MFDTWIYLSMNISASNGQRLGGILLQLNILEFEPQINLAGKKHTGVLMYIQIVCITLIIHTFHTMYNDILYVYTSDYICIIYNHTFCYGFELQRQFFVWDSFVYKHFHSKAAK